MPSRRPNQNTITTAANVREYISLKPPPVTENYGVNAKLKARNTSILSIAEPSRPEVRYNNYHRRRRQQTLQGYRTPCHKVSDNF